jgi:hypothetical protein
MVRTNIHQLLVQVSISSSLFWPSTDSAQFTFSKRTSAVGAALLLYYYQQTDFLEPSFVHSSTPVLFRGSSVPGQNRAGRLSIYQHWEL